MTLFGEPQGADPLALRCLLAQGHGLQRHARGEIDLEEGDLGLRVGLDELGGDRLVIIRQADHDLFGVLAVGSEDFAGGDDVAALGDAEAGPRAGEPFDLVQQPLVHIFQEVGEPAGGIQGQGLFTFLGGLCVLLRPGQQARHRIEEPHPQVVVGEGASPLFLLPLVELGHCLGERFLPLFLGVFFHAMERTAPPTCGNRRG